MVALSILGLTQRTVFECESVVYMTSITAVCDVWVRSALVWDCDDVSRTQIWII
jgi:hypothetical protein